MAEERLLPGVDVASFPAAAAAAWRELAAKVDKRGLAALETLLASLPRRVGRDQPWSGRAQAGERLVELAFWRTCDVGAALLLRRVSAEVLESPLRLRGMYDHGDAEERRMLLRSLPFLEPTSIWSELLEEAHRTNDEIIFSAGLLDSDLPASLLATEAFNRAVLKVAFLDLPATRIIGWESRANQQLSATLLDFRCERQAAGRKPWLDSLEIAAHAPVAGLDACVAGDLWHGSDERRLAAARAATVLGGEHVCAVARERLHLELRADITSQLKRCLDR